MAARVALVASGFPPPLTPPPCAGEGNQKTSPRPAGTPLLARRGAGGEDSYHEDIRRTAVASIHHIRQIQPIQPARPAQIQRQPLWQINRMVPVGTMGRRRMPPS